MAESKYKELIPRVLKTDKIMSTNRVREAVAEEAGVKYVDFNLIARLLEQLAANGKVEKLESVKREVYWRKA